MRATFLIGPAGTGKTHRCLAEARAAVQRAPEGLPLLFLAPRQATYQLERDLLSDSELEGYTRLQVLSFDRLARLVLASSPSRVLSVEGRVMVLRALLTRHHGQLKVFRGSARLPGFAHELSDGITELQSHCVSPAMLLTTAETIAHNPQLANKLRDLALIFGAYVEWLERAELYDTGSLLDLAADAVRKGMHRDAFRWEAMWLDGFAQLTPQEMALLLAIVPRCQRATLAFCADEISEFSDLKIFGSENLKISAMQALAECTVEIENLPRRGEHNRFSGAPALAHLESAWESSSSSAISAEGLNGALRLVSCPNPEAEAALAAQEILRHARGGGRFRDCGVIVRDLSGYHDAIRRVFTHYEIPFFIDRREPVAHHPLPELVRSSLRLAAFDWQLDDWLGVLKTGLLADDESEIDALENEGLERGWSGKIWRQPLPALDGSRALALERLRQKLVPPFARFTDRLLAHPGGPSGHEMAGALDQLWSELRITRALEAWSASEEATGRPAAVHRTIWEQMQEWVADLGLAFGDQRLDLRQWIMVVDAGLSRLTVGVVPPALDQVLVGAVDRSRNPNLELAIVLGLNETVFPAPPARPVLLNERDREELEGSPVKLELHAQARAAQEHYYGYIACTRARRRLVLSYSAFDAMDRKLNPSVFVSRVRRMFPALPIDIWREPETWLDAEHASDVLPALIAQNEFENLQIFKSSNSPSALNALRARLEAARNFPMADALSPGAAERLYGRELRTSITSLERFGQCPFKFLVQSGLRAQERKLFQVDRRKLGDFQHRVLKAFHDQLKAEAKLWRDVTPQEARRRIAQISEESARSYNHGLFAASARQRFALRQLSLALQDFIEVIVGWMGQYAFEPVASELRFAGDGEVPAWRLALTNGRALLLNGSIDRVDLLKQADGTAWCVALDFKSSARKIDPVFLHNGVQMQLPAYLSMLRRLEDPRERFGVAKLKPAGLFYVGLRASHDRAEHRNKVLHDPRLSRREGYRHAGRFDVTTLDSLDATRTGDQFNYSFKKDGALDSRSKDPMEPAQFIELLDAVEARLRDFGERVFAGEARVAPYRRASETACTFCDYRPVCRIDPWSHQYRSLEIPPAP